MSESAVVPGAGAFADTPRGKLVAGEPTNAVEPVTFYSTDGGSYTSTDPVEITRLKSRRSHFLTPAQAEDPVAADDTRFHPGDHTVADVNAYLAENPADAERVIAEEQAGSARKGIVDTADKE